ncbi:MAG: hypothetical protein Fur0042_01450 [Cyanophyceae cyanobacterium]
MVSGKVEGSLGAAGAAGAAGAIAVVPPQIRLTAATGKRGHWSGSVLLHLQLRPGDRGASSPGEITAMEAMGTQVGWPERWSFCGRKGGGALPPGVRATFVPLSPTVGLVRLRVTPQGQRAGLRGTLWLEFLGTPHQPPSPWSVAVTYQLLPPPRSPLAYRSLLGIVLFFWSATAIATASAPEAAIAILIGFTLGMGAGDLVEQRPIRRILNRSLGRSWSQILRWPTAYGLWAGFLILLLEGHWRPVPLLLKAIAGGLCGSGIWREVARLTRSGERAPPTKESAIAAMTLGSGLGLGCGLGFTHPLALGLILPAALGLALMGYGRHRRPSP